MTAGHVLTVEAQNLIETFATARVAAGLGAWGSILGGARAFCARYPDPTAFTDASL